MQLALVLIDSTEEYYKWKNISPISGAEKSA